MNIYIYVVHSHPNNVGEGTVFNELKAAREFVGQYGNHGACISEVKYSFEDSELIEDTRPEAEEGE